ncbi:MAG: hypothetical protein M3R57_10595 [Chloroflexota bacterium]|nr:hypothetical protein [Chloroflexota bacterium]
MYDAPGGAHPQLGLLVAGIGVLFAFVGALLAARSWADPQGPPRPRALPRRSVPVQPRPGSDGYATSARVERRDPPGDA